MEINLIKELALEKIEIPTPFEPETVIPILERIFTNNPYHWDQARNYELLGNPRPLWFIEKWVTHSFEIYHGSYRFEAPNLMEEKDKRYHSEDAMRWELAWGWSRAKRPLLPLVYWNADHWLNQHGFQLRGSGGANPGMTMEKVKEVSSLAIPMKFYDFPQYLFFRKKREDNDWDEVVKVRCGSFKAEQVYFNWGCDFLVFPFPVTNETEMCSTLDCYYLHFNEPLQTRES